MLKTRIINLFLLILLVALLFNVSRTLVDLNRQNNIIKETEDRLQKSKVENEKLKRDLAMVESSEYIEKEARNKLNLGKEGEIVLLLPSISPIISPTPAPIDDFANWQRWIKLFL